MVKYVKLKKYERKDLVFLAVLLLILMELIFFVGLYVQKVSIYEKFQVIVRKDDVVTLVVDQEQLMLFRKNNYIYVDDKKREFSIIKTLREVLERKNVKYHEIYIKFSFDDDKKENDIIDIAIEKEKIRGIEIFKIIMEGVFE